MRYWVQGRHDERTTAQRESAATAAANTCRLDGCQATQDVEVGVTSDSATPAMSGTWRKTVDEKVELRFRDLQFSIGTSRSQTFFGVGTRGTTEILRGVSGVVETGQILAIIGPSGAGKTSLLDILVGKTATDSVKGFSVTGDINLNGQPMSRSLFLENAAYVPQEDRLWSALTVRENLMFACKMYSPHLRQGECDTRVDEVLASLGLTSCQTTKVGNVFIKGLSGGQKRRTSIGVELVVQRRILFLDEPTSGLDAASAAEIMALLRRLSSDTGMIIVTSVHQPSTQVFNSFDQVILLTMGRTAYFGPASSSLEYFAKQGYEPRGMVNPADYLLEITNSDFSDCAAVEHLADSWLEADDNARLTRVLDAEPSATLSVRGRQRLVSAKQLNLLIERAMRNNSRDPAAYVVRLGLYVVMSVFLGSVYYKVENTQSDILNRVFLILWINAFNSYMDMAAIPVFGLEKEAVVKEVQNGQYSIFMFCVANAVVQVPFVFLSAICCTTPVYWGTSMNDSGERFIMYISIMFLMLYVVESMAQLIGVLIKNFILALAFFAVLLSQFFIFNGFFVDPDIMPGFWVWLYWLSPSRYAWECLAWIVFEGQTYAGMEGCNVCYGETGQEVLTTLSSNGGTDLTEVSILKWGGALCGLAMFWRVVHFWAMRQAVL